MNAAKPRGLALVALAAVLAGQPLTPRAARQARTVVGDVIKAARLVNAMRFDEAKTVISELAQKSPDTPEVRWLRSTLAFNQGDYAGAVAALNGIGDDGADGEVGAMRKLAAQSLAVTSDFIERKS
ncbi:MAG TPA: hypothetical protein PLF40_17110, partial [Kofleriaceae bacterium]|nr:hypothetical protein [Kofleriaceae bacterium]